MQLNMGPASCCGWCRSSLFHFQKIADEHTTSSVGNILHSSVSEADWLRDKCSICSKGGSSLGRLKFTVFGAHKDICSMGSQRQMSRSNKLITYLSPEPSFKMPGILISRSLYASMAFICLKTMFNHIIEIQGQLPVECLSLLSRLLEIVWNLKACKSQRLLGWLFGGNRMVIVSPVRLFGKYSNIYQCIFAMHRLAFISVKQCAKPRTQNLRLCSICTWCGWSIQHQAS